MPQCQRALIFNAFLISLCWPRALNKTWHQPSSQVHLESTITQPSFPYCSWITHEIPFPTPILAPTFPQSRVNYKGKKKRILCQWQKIQIISFGQGNDISKAPLIARKLCCIKRHLPKDIAACVTPLPWCLVALCAPRIRSSGFPKAQADHLGKEGNKASGKETITLNNNYWPRETQPSINSHGRD